ncbi:DUF2062 domain-containing protein [Sulfuriroseicoccus oceanibius]|uniref:DUF2062 domain-containing protein n=1 Tax=Sulfuriroseicoccus oceanibius TaxID=2707525 RepID=A0A6B3LBA1_9BACT|nr:DUF2062 domain-containing protein [Sulfuriroseicoccus oceanibius]QQL44403.1 DUF2062 domain-containing protein [Sulfuriroseicoccus oceanibius]
MDRHYRKFARRIYRYFRHPKRRKQAGILGWIGGRVFDRSLWVPAREPMIGALACGLAVAMLPPVIVSQMVVAALICVWRRWNIPVAVGCCWLSNPVTWVPQVLMQVRLGRMLLQTETEALPAKPVAGLSPETILDWARTHALEYSVGIVLSMLICAVVGWLAGSALWYLFGHYVKVPHRVPRRPDAEGTKGAN